jgi:hypothetical protein
MWQFPVTVKFVWLDILRILLNVSTLFWYIAWELEEIVELAEILASDSRSWSTTTSPPIPARHYIYAFNVLIYYKFFVN